MLSFLTAFLFTSHASAMLFRSHGIQRAPRVKATRTLGFSDAYMSELKAAGPQDVSTIDEPFYKNIPAWKTAAAGFSPNYWNFDPVPKLDFAGRFNFSESVAKFNKLTNQLRRNPTANPKEFFEKPLYEGRQEYLSQIPVDLLFEWMDVLEQMNLRQRSIVLQKEAAITILTQEKAVQLQRAAELEKTVADLQKEKAKLETELEETHAAFEQSKEANLALVSKNKELVKEVENVKSVLANTQRALELEKYVNANLAEKNEEIEMEKAKITGHFEQVKKDLISHQDQAKSDAAKHLTTVSGLQQQIIQVTAGNASLRLKGLASEDQVQQLSEELARCKATKKALQSRVSMLQRQLELDDLWASDNWRHYQHLE